MASSETAEPIAALDRQISPALVRTLAAACAVSVANLYYCQPLLVPMARSLHVTQVQIGIVPTLTQLGYATGLFFLVPLGDVLEARRLILVTLAGVTLSLLAAACAPSLGLLALFSYLIGLTTVVPQMLIPFGVRLSSPAERGKTVGNIMGGLLFGLLLSRTAAGFVGAHLGWRAMYGIASGLMVALAVVLRLLLPESPPIERLHYRALLGSVIALAREEPLLREAALVGGLVFGAFSVFWATLSFLLLRAFGLGPQAAGLFGLVGAAGALIAPVAGRLADRSSPRMLVGIAAALVLLSYLLFGTLGGVSIAALIVGVVVLDLGVQAAQVSNQTRIYRLRPAAGSRLNTVYMTTYFVGGALGSDFAVRGWSAGGWHGVCWVGGIFAASALLVTVIAGLRQPRMVR